MIIFYEGLPRSGKSLNALKDYIVPMLKKGRKVFAYLNGLNHDHIAVLADIPPEQCRELLHPLTAEQVPTVYDHVENDAFVVLDELQNFWPSTREKLNPDITKFITEHGHRGLDILCMGQDIKDIHNLWRRRVAQKVYFLKRDAAGKPDEFTAIVFKPVPKGKDVVFEEIRSIKGQKYDQSYFGAYASHTDETANKETLVDDRANVWNHPFIKKWLPLYGVVFVGAIVYVVYMFKSGGLVGGTKPEKKAQDTPAVTTQAAPVPATMPVLPKAAEPAEPSPQPAPVKPAYDEQAKSPAFVDPMLIPDDPPDIVDHLSKTARIRLSGYIQMGNKVSGVIEWYNESQGVVDRMSFDELQMMGWHVLVNQTASLAIIQKYHSRYIATAWPKIDQDGKVTQARLDLIRDEGLSHAD
ncbi:zonular occludens toxin domain-containing protein [Methylobacillus pratensis]